MQTPLGVQAGPATYETIGTNFIPYSLSGDGEIIAGLLIEGPPYGRAVVFDGEFHDLPLPDVGAVVSVATPRTNAMSRDGTVVAGLFVALADGGSSVHHPIYWDAERKPHLIEVPSFPQGEAWGVSPSGNVIVGRGYQDIFDDRDRAFVWQAGEVSLLATPSGATSRAYAASESGDLIVGEITERMGTGSAMTVRTLPTVWNQSVPEYLPLPPEWKSGYAHGISADGGTLLGIAYGDNDAVAAFRWVRSSSTWAYTQVDEPMFLVYDISPDGRIMSGLGYDLIRGAFDGVLWREGAGSILLQDYLQSQGLSGPTAVAAFMSDDGRTIVGSTDPFLLGGDAFRLRLATPDLVGDANGDCQVGAADYTIWAAQFGQSGWTLSADFDGNGSVGTGDYALWAANFGKTCEPAAALGVPEPASGLLAAVAGGGLTLGLRRRFGRQTT